MISIIVAIAMNNVIGGDNRLLWHIPKDLKHFREITDAMSSSWVGRLLNPSAGAANQSMWC